MIGEATNAPNQALELTATRRVTTCSMIKTFGSHSLLGAGSRRSAWSR